MKPECEVPKIRGSCEMMGWSIVGNVVFLQPDPYRRQKVTF